MASKGIRARRASITAAVFRGTPGALFCAAAFSLLAACDENLTIIPDRDKATGPAVVPLACVPNLDGKIDSSELAAAIGVDVNYVVSPPGTVRSVDLEGTAAEGGRLEWTFSADFADDQALVITPRLAKDQWYAASFPPDAFVTPFDAGGRVDSIGRLTDQGRGYPADGIVVEKKSDCCHLEPGFEFAGPGDVDQCPLPYF